MFDFSAAHTTGFKIEHVAKTCCCVLFLMLTQIKTIKPIRKLGIFPFNKSNLLFSTFISTRWGFKGRTAILPLNDGPMLCLGPYLLKNNQLDSQIKPLGQLVWVSSMHYCTYTSHLSTSSSTTDLSEDFSSGDLILRGASRLDAFSGYPVGT